MPRFHGAVGEIRSHAAIGAGPIPASCWIAARELYGFASMQACSIGAQRWLTMPLPNDICGRVMAAFYVAISQASFFARLCELPRSTSTAPRRR